MRLLRDLSPSAIVAGFVTVLVGYTSSAVIVFQAARASGGGPAEIASWMWALGLGMGVTCIGLSLRYRVPVVTAWSTPGAALLATSAVGLPMPAMIGAFLVSAVLMVIAGATGWFERGMSRIPVPLASGMLAGVLLRFGLDAFVAMKTQLGLALADVRHLPRRPPPLAALRGGGRAGARRRPRRRRAACCTSTRSSSSSPVRSSPRRAFSLSALFGVAIPLFVVTMASQNVPGVAVLRASGYGETPISPLVTWTGLATVVAAPFGGYALNLAAITAAICMGREAHEDPARRYVAAVAAGAFYVLLGLFAATVGALFAAFPRELVWSVAGLALFNTIGGGLAAAVSDPGHREPALVTFLVTASGLSLFGVGAAFWGLVAGLVATLVLRRR